MVRPWFPPSQIIPVLPGRGIRKGYGTRFCDTQRRLHISIKTMVGYTYAKRMIAQQGCFFNMKSCLLRFLDLD